MIPRAVNIGKLLKPGKVLILYGARRVGKTTLLQEFLRGSTFKARIDSGDNIRIQHLFASQDFSAMAEYAEGYNLIAIDEAQQIKSIGQALKILVDTHPTLRIIATGSSSFDLAQSVGEPLTGRKKTVVLFPLSLLELRERYNRQELRERLGDFMLFGMYPEVILARSKKAKIDTLYELVDSYLLKDVLSVETVRGSKQIMDLLKLLAFQIGKEVSLSELAGQVRLDVKTVARYLDILERGFILRRVGAFSRNLRKEVASKAKYYFADTGIRNAVIRQFNAFGDRNDVGELFENFVVMERFKYCAYRERPAEAYFWRTYDGQEIDLIEERNGVLTAFEVKWSERAKHKVPPAWKAAYPRASMVWIDPKNVLSFLLDGTVQK